MYNKAPIYASLVAYAADNNLRLHMPGHIGEPGYLVKELQEIAKLDLTEVADIDDLHLPVGAIKEAQSLLAQAFKAKESLFLVNGATSGVHALLLSLANKGKKVVIPRNAHRSFYGGLVLSGLWPEYLSLAMEPNTGIALGITPQAVKSVLESGNDIGGVFLTSPTYYGTTLDIGSIADDCRLYNIPLFIDEAHGSHFPFHPAYPTPALWQGADAVVNGLHKSWPVLNQGACLHLAAACKGDQEIKTAVSLITTTSPSFPLLASIDLARALMEEMGTDLLEKSLQLSREFKNKINTIKGLSSLSEEFKDVIGVYEIDPLKVLVRVQGLSINGYELANILRREYKIQVELQEEAIILAMFSMFHRRSHWEKFYYALEQIARRYNIDSLKQNVTVIPPAPQVILTPRQAYYSQKRTVKLEESAGLISGEIVAAYPPGIPGLLPGELITAEIIDYLLYLRANKVRIQGPRDSQLLSIDVTL